MDRHKAIYKRPTARFTVDQFNEMKQNAEKAGMTVNDYLVHSALSGKFIFKYSPKEAEKIRKEMISIHRAFSQTNVLISKIDARSLDDVSKIIESQKEIKELLSKYIETYDSSSVANAKNAGKKHSIQEKS